MSLLPEGAETEFRVPLAPAEVEKRIQTVLQAPAMPESWERRRAR